MADLEYLSEEEALATPTSPQNGEKPEYMSEEEALGLAPSSTEVQGNAPNNAMPLTPAEAAEMDVPTGTFNIPSGGGFEMGQPRTAQAAAALPRDPALPKPPQTWGGAAWDVAAPIGAAAAIAPAFSNPITAALASGLMYAGSKKLNEEAKTMISEAFPGSVSVPPEGYKSNVTGDITAGTIPQIFARGAGHLAPPSVRVPAQILAAGFGAIQAKMLEIGANQWLEGKPIDIPESPSEYVLPVALSAGAEMGVTGLAKGLMGQAGLTTEAIPALYRNASSWKNSLLTYVMGSPVVQGWIKKDLDPLKKKEVEGFLKSLGTPPSGEVNFSAYKKTLLDSLENLTGTSAKETEQAIEKIVTESVGPSETKGVMNALTNFIKLADAQEGMALGDKVIKDSLRAIKTPKEKIAQIYQVGQPVANSADDALTSVINAIPDAKTGSIESAKAIVPVLKPIIDDAKSAYKEMVKKFDESNLSSVPMDRTALDSVISEKKGIIDLALASLRSRFGKLPGVLDDLAPESSENPSIAEVIQNIADFTDTQIRGSVKDLRQPVKTLSVGHGLELGRGLNAIKRVTKNSVEKQGVEALLDATKRGIAATAEKSKLKPLADLYASVNQGYASAMEKLKVFDPILEKIIPGWQYGGKTFSQVPEKALAIMDTWTSKKKDQFLSHLDLLGKDVRRNVEGNIKQAEVGRIARTANTDGFNPEKFKELVMSSRILSDAEKRPMLLSSDAGIFRLSLTKENLMDQLVSGSPEAWKMARNKASSLGMTDGQLEKTIFSEKVLKPSFVDGVFSPKEFAKNVSANAPLLKASKTEKLAENLMGDKGIFELGAKELKDLTSTFNGMENMEGFIDVLLSKQATVSPKNIARVMGVMTPENKTLLQQAYVNKMVGKDPSIKSVLANFGRMIDPAAGGQAPATVKAILGEKPYAALEKMVTAYKKLERWAPVEDVLPSSLDWFGRGPAGLKMPLEFMRNAANGTLGAMLLTPDGVAEMNALSALLYSVSARLQNQNK